jgi:hypothetical protein
MSSGGKLLRHLYVRPHSFDPVILKPGTGNGPWSLRFPAFFFACAHPSTGARGCLAKDFIEAEGLPPSTYQRLPPISVAAYFASSSHSYLSSFPSVSVPCPCPFSRPCLPLCGSFSIGSSFCPEECGRPIIIRLAQNHSLLTYRSFLEKGQLKVKFHPVAGLAIDAGSPSPTLRNLFAALHLCNMTPA